MAGARIFRVIVPVTDIDTAAAFYARLLGDPGERVVETRHYFQCGDVIIACVRPFDHVAGAPAALEDFRPNPDDLYFAVDDLEAAFERARSAGCSSLDEAIQHRPWGERSFYLRDPFGNELCFVDSVTLFTGN